MFKVGDKVVTVRIVEDENTGSGDMLLVGTNATIVSVCSAGADILTSDGEWQVDFRDIELGKG